MSASLPFFRLHPDPIASGSIREVSATCACCERRRGWIYTATFYTALDVSGPFCPWCTADGSAAQRFEGELADFVGLEEVSEDVLHEVTRRTPGSHAWQDPHWRPRRDTRDDARCGGCQALRGVGGRRSSRLPGCRCPQARYGGPATEAVVSDRSGYGLVAMIASVRITSSNCPEGAKPSNAVRRSSSKASFFSPSWAGLE